MSGRIRRAIAVAVGCAAIAAACTGDGDDTVPTTVAATTTTTPVREDDGRLQIGLLLPTTDALLGQGLVAAAEDAIAQINEAGGVLGSPVRTVVTDEGTTASVAAASIDELIDSGVDAIIGPSSSVIALDRLSQIVDAGIVACSPTASSMALDRFPDDNLFFRTIPSDSLQAVAIAQVVQDTGEPTADIVYVDDAFGQPFSEEVEDQLDTLGIDVVTSIPFSSGDTDLSEAIAALVGSEAGVAVLIANADDAANFLEAIDQSGFAGISSIVVNDALRSPANAARIEALGPTLRRRVTGVAPQATSDTPGDPSGPFAIHAFDCVNLIALAAVQGGSAAPRDIALQIPSVSSGGRLCRNFETCSARLDEGLQIDYGGPSGITDLLQRGDPRRARFELFSFDETGRDQRDGTIVVEY